MDPEIHFEMPALLPGQYIEDSTGVESLKRIEELLEDQAKAGAKKEE